MESQRLSLFPYKLIASINCLSLDPSIVQTLEWTLPYNLYKNELVDQAALMLTLSGRVSETNQVLATQFDFRLRTPDIIITVSLSSDFYHCKA